jgi:monofunctional biosynthetic peptidoglycan transglycosylase
MSQSAKPSRNQKVKKIIFRIIRFGLIFFFGTSIVFTLIYRFVSIPATPLMLIRVVENIAEGKKPSITKDWVHLKDISPNLVLAVIA